MQNGIIEKLTTLVKPYRPFERLYSLYSVDLFRTA
jgi:hypothetical protein